MVKTIKSPCVNCSHINVCKHLDAVDRLLEDMNKFYINGPPHESGQFLKDVDYISVTIECSYKEIKAPMQRSETSAVLIK